MDKNKDEVFLDRYFQEYKLRDRIKLSLILSMVFFPAFLILDAIVTPSKLRAVLVIRLVVVFINLVQLILLRFLKSRRYVLSLAMSLLVIDAWGRPSLSSFSKFT